MYVSVPTAIAERAQTRNLTIEQWSRFYLIVPISVPPTGHIWTTASGLNATRARMMIRREVRAQATVIALDSEGGSPAITIDLTNAPALVVLTINMGALLTGTFVPEDEEVLGTSGAAGLTNNRELSTGNYDITVELGNDPQNTWRVLQGEITLSEQITRPIS